MKTPALQFNNIVETIYSLPLEDRLEIINLLGHNIADTRRTNITSNFKKAQDEHKAGRLKFSSSIDELKKML
jgi:hypothetical protein